MAYKNKLDAKKANQEHYRKNKSSYVARNNAQKELNREILRKLKEVPCMDCNKTYPYYVMDFDHRDPSKKNCNVTYLVTYSTKKMLDEVSKCDVVCSNCHRERTHLQRISQSYNGSMTVSKTVRVGSIPT